MSKMIDQYFVKTNIWVAVCFTAMLAFFQLSLYELNFYVLGIVFFGTLAVYNFTRIKNLEKLKISFAGNSVQIILTVLGLTGTLICVIFRGFELKTFLYLAVLGFMSFCYSLPFSNLGLRGIPFLKLFLIAFVWAGSSIGLLLIVHHSLIHYHFLFFAVFFFVVGITIPFDIRDKITDESELKTIPQTIGPKSSKWVSFSSLIISGLLFYFEFQILNFPVISWWFTLLISILFVFNSNSKRSDFYFSFWVESCSLLPLIFYGLFQFFEF
jgi:4-hydroxybenzoate polyprenyltransferase